jgi:hypothetical protein
VLVAELRAAVQRLERELGDARAERDHWRTLADAERQRFDRLLEQQAERPAQRRRHGLIPALRRLWWGDDWG